MRKPKVAVVRKPTVPAKKKAAKRKKPTPKPGIYVKVAFPKRIRRYSAISKYRDLVEQENNGIEGAEALAKAQLRYKVTPENIMLMKVPEEPQ